MSEPSASSTLRARQRTFAGGGAEEELPKWLTVSFGLHVILIAMMFAVSLMPSARAPAPPVYVVDLIGGEKIGRANFGTEIAPASTPPARRLEPKESELPAKTKEETEVPAVVEKKNIAVPEPKEEEKKAPTVVENKTATKKKTISPNEEPVKDLAKVNSTKKIESQAKPPPSADDVRERLIQAAAERAKTRAVSAQKQPKGEVLSAGTGEGDGAASLGDGGRGGLGVLKGMEFIIYQNRMLSTIKDNWAWVGQRPDLKVVVHFGIKDNGEISGLKIVQPSGDATYDESVLRAVKKSSPLPAPPSAYRNDFADVELTFRPRDLGA